MSERDTVREDRCQKRYAVGQDHDPDLDQGSVNLGSLLPNHSPDPGKVGEIMHDCKKHLSPPETKWIYNQKKRGNADPDPDQAQEKGGKMKDHPEVHKKLQRPVLHRRQTQSNYRTRRNRKMPHEAL